MGEHVKNYYIGDPDSKYKRGQDEDGYVHCLLWLSIYKKGEFFAEEDEYSLGRGGCGIGKVKSVTEGVIKLHEFAKEQLLMKRENVLNELSRIQDALEELGDNPENLKLFEGEYKSKDAPG